jgi:hypothetical protein
MLARLVDGPFTDSHLNTGDVFTIGSQTWKRQRGMRVFGVEGGKEYFHGNESPFALTSGGAGVNKYTFTTEK